MPSAPVLPMTWPPLIPPPANTVVQAAGKWSRPAWALIFGVRPNSPIQTISVESSSPRLRRSSISVAHAGSSTSLSFLTARSFADACPSRRPCPPRPMIAIPRQTARPVRPAGGRAGSPGRRRFGRKHRASRRVRPPGRKPWPPPSASTGRPASRRPGGSGADAGMARQEIFSHRSSRPSLASARRLVNARGQVQVFHLERQLAGVEAPCRSPRRPRRQPVVHIADREILARTPRVERTDRRDADEVGQLGIVAPQLLGDSEPRVG